MFKKRETKHRKVSVFLDSCILLWDWAVFQPLTAAVASTIILASGLVRKCHGSKDSDKTCLYGPNLADLGAIGIVIGLYCIIYSDKKARRKEELFIGINSPQSNLSEEDNKYVPIKDNNLGYKELGWFNY